MAGELDDVPYQSLYRRFRPSKFSEVRGQDHVVLALRNAVRDRRVAHAYLFSGPRGTGKTSTARILAKALNCTELGDDGEPCGMCTSCTEIARGSSLDVHELDAASNNGVDAMRDLVSRAALGTPGRQKVYIVDEVHMLSTAASNALLKTLEEPPAHVVFVLATTDPQKVLPTIRSRTQHFEFRLLGAEVLGGLLDEVRRSAGLDVADEALDLAVRRGRGSARDALSVLDQVTATDSIDDDLPDLASVIDALTTHDVEQALVAVGHLVAAGFSPQQLAGDLAEQLRQGFLALVAPDLVTVSPNERDALAERARHAGLAALVRAMEMLGQAQVTMRDAPDPRVNLEVALVKLTHPEADESPGALLVRIERLEAGAPSRPDEESGSSARVTPAAPAPPAARASPAAHAPPATRHEPEVTPPASPTGPDSTRGPGRARRTVGAVRREAVTSPTHDVPAPSSGDEPPPEDPGEGRAAPAPHGDASDPSVSFPSRDELVQAWGDHILGRLRPKARALFQAGRFVGVDGESAIYGLPNEMHRRRCEDALTDVESALSDHFGRTVKLTLVVDDGVGRTVRADGPGATSSAADLGAQTGDEHGMGDDVHELGEAADVDNSVESRLLQAFPGAEEVR